MIAGRRRFLALKSLAEAGTIRGDSVIPCHLIDADANATEISLVENAVRAQMHPADEFEAFLALIEDGMRAPDIAARFGVTEAVVQQRLKLARVSPVIIEAYRRGEITLAHVMAFAVADDHAAQERVWDELSEWQCEDPDTIRSALTEDEVTATDRRVKFVTLKAYEKAGGAVRRDLFAQDDSGVFIQDVVLLESLVAKKLEKIAAGLRKDGWKWVEIRSEFDYSEWSKCSRVHAEPAPLCAEQQAELDALRAEYDKLRDGDDGAAGDHDDDDDQRLDDLLQRIDEIEDREAVWQPETRSIAGTVVSLDYRGKAEIHYGYVLSGDAPKKKRSAETFTDENGAVVAADEKSPLSAALIEDLSAQRSAAMAACLNGNTEVALTAVVHAIALQVFYEGSSRDTCLQICASSASLRHVQESPALDALVRARETWAGILPANPGDFWTWCLSQDRDRLLGLMAYCAARTVNAVQRKGDRADCERLRHAPRLGEALRLDMTKWFKPTAGNYFGRITKPAILAALAEVKGSVAPSWEKAKKSDLAVIAEREIGGSGWLPGVLIGAIPAYSASG